MNDVPDNQRPVGDRPDDRFGLDAFDRVPVPDQWNDIVARSGEVEIAATDLRRTGQWAMVAAVVALLAGGVIAIVLRNTDGAAVRGSSTDVPTTFPTVPSAPVSSVTTVPRVVEPTLVPSESTLAPSTTSATMLPTTTIPAVVNPTTLAWSVACTEVAGDADATYDFDRRLADFTTIGAVPALELQLPVVNSTSGRLDPLVDVRQIPGGVLVLVKPPGEWPLQTSNVDTSSLVAVNSDGSIRWRRCFDGTPIRSVLVAPAELEPTAAWVPIQDFEADLIMRGFDLTTGVDVATTVDGVGQTIRTTAGRFAVIGQHWNELTLELTDRIQVFDALDGSVVERPYPPDASNRLGDLSIEAILSETGELVLIDHVPQSSSVRSVDVGDGWTNDLAAVRAAAPSQITETYGEPYELRFVDGAGDVVWAVADFHSVPREGFHTAVADSVVVAVRCVGWTAENGCGWVGETPPVEELVGYDKATGEELWVRDGAEVSIIAGDIGIVGDADGYHQIDLTTGEPMESAAPFADQWPSGAFANECCGGGDYTYAFRDGGIVIAVDRSNVRIWLPPELTSQTTTAVSVLG